MRGGECIFLANGKLSPCGAPFTNRHFNRYFGKEYFKISRRDYIDIYKAKDIQEIFRFLSRPIPFCRYCRPKRCYIEYGTSKREMTEWI